MYEKITDTDFLRVKLYKKMSEAKWGWVYNLNNGETSFQVTKKVRTGFFRFEKVVVLRLVRTKEENMRLFYVANYEQEKEGEDITYLVDQAYLLSLCKVLLNTYEIRETDRELREKSILDDISEL